ncbi:MAG: hypothetical protein N3G21_01325 [Candidatus Hydrogenedentes bacterium]|nr:hypothetical protein [Candidatus Hydrogenedentota bacterium]
MFISRVKLLSVIKNILLVLLSIIFVFLVVILIDRIIFSQPFSYFSKKPIPIIFPPFSEEEFVSSDFRYTVKINSIGLRNREVNIPKPENIFRIIVIGDSYTYGWGIEEEQSWVRLIESMLSVPRKKVEVINMGKPGANLNDYLEIARIGIPILEPDLVILALLQGDDLFTFYLQKDSPRSVIQGIAYALFPNISKRVAQYLLIKKLSINSEDMFIPRNSAEKNISSAKNSALEILSKLSEEKRKMFDSLDSQVRQYFLDGMLNPFLVYVALEFPDFLLKMITEEDFSKTQEFNSAIQIISKINEIGMVNKSKLIIFSVPQSFYVNEHALKSAEKLGFKVDLEMLSSDKLDIPIIQISNHLKIPYVSITEEMREHKHSPTLFFPLDMHPTPEGHRLIAEHLAPKIQKLLEDIYRFR